MYLGLSSTDPNSDGSGVTEPTAASYARLAVAPAAWNAAANRAKTNAADLVWAAAAENWIAPPAKAVYVVVFSAGEGGTFRGYAVIGDGGRSIEAGDTFRVAAGSGAFTLPDAD